MQSANRLKRGLLSITSFTGALLLGLAELNEREDVPTKVIINEVVELAKRYGPADCFRFVNAVLDRAAKSIASRRTT